MISLGPNDTDFIHQGVTNVSNSFQPIPFYSTSLENRLKWNRVKWGSWSDINRDGMKEEYAVAVWILVQRIQIIMITLLLFHILEYIYHFDIHMIVKRVETKIQSQSEYYYHWWFKIGSLFDSLSFCSKMFMKDGLPSYRTCLYIFKEFQHRRALEFGETYQSSYSKWYWWAPQY